MNDTTTEHNQWLERIAAHVAGGLEESERAELEAHVAVCAACAAGLAEAREQDRRLNELFAEVRPREGLEDRIVRGLRGRWWRRLTLVHPMVRRVAAGVAAAVVLGAVGYHAGSLMEMKQERVTSASGLTEFDKDPFLGGQRPADNDVTAALLLWPRVDGVSPDVFVSPGSDSAVVNEMRSALGRRVEPTGDGDGVPSPYADLMTYPSNQPASLGLRGRESADEVARRSNEAVAERLSAPVLGDVSARGQALAKDVKESRSLRRTGEGKLGLFSESESTGVTHDGHVAGDAYMTNLNDALGGDVRIPASTPGEAEGGSGGYPGSAFGANSAMPIHALASKDPAQPGAPASTFKPGDAVHSLSQVGTSAAAPVAGPAGLSSPARQSVADGPAAPSADRPAAPGGSAPVFGRRMDMNASLAIAANQSTAGGPAPQPVEQIQRPAPSERALKIIRHGDMEFEVDSYDSAFMVISKIVAEEGGYVASASSEKLPNGKVKGTTTVRVPPDRLDVLVLKLRALGDLRSQRIASQDITKVYYDLDAELRAARAMEERLLKIIESGKGEVKDLLEAERQLGEYRQKREKIEGEIRFYNDRVSLSTLNITAFERDIRTAGLASITEQANMGIEAEDVEKARADALAAIEAAKGRIIESKLNRLDAGQFSATIVAEVAPDAAGPLIDRMKQLGRMARLDIDRRQTTADGSSPLPGARIERKDTRLAISIYNLANIAPRQTVNINIAVASVEDAYQTILKTVADRGGRVVASSLNRQKPEQTTASINFEVPAAEAEAAQTEVRAGRDVMTLTVTENPDTQNVTAAKRGFTVQVFSLATVAARQSEQIALTVAGSLPDAFNALVEAARKAEARIITSQLNTQEKADVAGVLEIEVPRTREIEFNNALSAAGIVLSRNVARSPDTQNTVDSKVRQQIRLISIDRLAPRETFGISLAAGADVPSAYQALLASLAQAATRIVSSQLNERDRQNVSGLIDFEILTASRPAVDKLLADAGVVFSRSVSRSTDTQNTVEFKQRLQVALVGAEQVPPRRMSQLAIVVGNVEDATGRVVDAVLKARGRIVDSRQSMDTGGRISSRVQVNVPLREADALRAQFVKLGRLRAQDLSENPQAPGDETLGRATFDLTLANAELLLPQDKGLWTSVKDGLATSIAGLLWSVQYIVVGLFMVGPWALLCWAGWRLWKRSRRAARTA